MAKVRIFIGSSTEGLVYANELQALLDHDLEVTIWTQDVFSPGKTAIQSLYEALSRFDMAVFLFTPDDEVITRGTEYEVVRDNVIFELGLFAGRIGIENTMFASPRSKPIKIPSDLYGVSYITFNDTRTDGNISASLGIVANAIKKRSNKLERLKSVVKAEAEIVSDHYYDKRMERRIKSKESNQNNSNVLIEQIMQDGTLGLVYIDIDKLTSIADIFGEEVADNVINEVKIIVDKYLRESPHNKGGRIFGDSFIIKCESRRAAALANEVREEVRSFDWSKMAINLYVTCCTGVAIRKPDEQKEMSELWIIRAIQSCINAKKQGGNISADEVLGVNKRMRLLHFLSSNVS